jgi:hypothetical protein
MGDIGILSGPLHPAALWLGALLVSAMALLHWDVTRQAANADVEQKALDNDLDHDDDGQAESAQPIT